MQLGSNLRVNDNAEAELWQEQALAYKSNLAMFAGFSAHNVHMRLSNTSIHTL